MMNEQFLALIREVKDTHRFLLFMHFCKGLLESGASVEDICEAWVQFGLYFSSRCFQSVDIRMGKNICTGCYAESRGKSPRYDQRSVEF